MTKNSQKKESLVFAQKDVFPKLARLYRQNGKISELSSDVNELSDMACIEKMVWIDEMV